jgi:hypothetical protein
MQLVEQCSGVGGLKWRGETFTGIRYRINRFQGQAPNGLPVPGLHRIEGTLELGGLADAARLVGTSVTLELEDGRTLPLTLTDADGRVLAEGHGPKHGCSCC